MKLTGTFGMTKSNEPWDSGMTPSCWDDIVWAGRAFFFWPSSFDKRQGGGLGWHMAVIGRYFPHSL